MLGAIIGDIVGSRFEWHNIKTREFDLFDPACRPTDDTVMTLAIAKALLACKDDRSDLDAQAVRWMRELGRRYPHAGYGSRFQFWLRTPSPAPYNSFGNGSAMRVSPCAYAARSLEDALALARTTAGVTHDHPEGIRGAQAAAAAAYLALHGSGIREIREHVAASYYALDFTLDEIRPGYSFDVSCQGSVPQAITAFLESDSFEDALRGAVSIGGDSDTIAAIAGGIAGAYYGVPEPIAQRAMSFLDEYERAILLEFQARFPGKRG